MRRNLCVAALVGEGLFVGGSALAQSVANGSFEDVQIGFPYYSTSAGDIPGWTHGGSPGDALLWHIAYSDGGGTFYVTGDGNQFVTMGGGCCDDPGSASWSTTITGLTTGDTYTVHFKTSAETYYLSQTMYAQVGAGLVRSYSPSNSFSPDYWGNWVSENYSFVASGATANLSFWVTNQLQDMGLDAVSVTAGGVPEAPTWAMLLAGFAGLGFVAYRGSRRQALLTTKGPVDAVLTDTRAID
jgi:hypothetical protein